MKLGAWEAYTAGYTGSIRSVKQLGETAELSTIERGSTGGDGSKVDASGACVIRFFLDTGIVSSLVQLKV